MTNLEQLSTGGSSGAQSNTQNPQNSTQTSNLGQSRNVQTGTATSLLKGGSTGIPLRDTTVPTLTLSKGTPSTSPPPLPPSHHQSPVLLGSSVFLFVVAIVLFATATRSDKVKKTTKKP